MKTAEDIDAMADAVVSAIKSAIDGPSVAGRIQEPETRLAGLESRPLLKWAGIHTEGQEYREAQLVTRSGSLWVSTAATKSTPGTPGCDWRLIVKKGQS